MVLWQYRAALLVGSMVISGILIPTVYYFKKGKSGGSALTIKGCFTLGACLPDEVCKTKDCKTAANRFLNSMDTSVDKCQNFYKYACGKFIQNAKIEPYQVVSSTTTEVNHKLSKQYRDILMSKPRKDDPPCFTTVRKLYSLCMDEKKIEALGFQPIKDLLKKAGGWPVLDSNWNSRGWDLSKKMMELRQMGLNANSIMKLTVYEHKGKLSLQVDQPDLLLPAKTILQGSDNNHVKQHYTYMVKTAVLLGANSIKAEIDMGEVYKLTMFLAKIYSPPLNRDSAIPTWSLSAEYLNENMNFLDWFGILHGATGSTDPARVNLEIKVHDIDYIDDIGEYVVRMFSPETLMNYMLWYAIYSMVDLLPDSAREIEANYKKEIYGVSERMPRWKECVTVANKMTNALSALYIREHFGADIKSSASDIGKNIYEELRLRIREVDWMDQKTKDLADLKAEMMTLNIGFSEASELNDVSKVEKKYLGLKIDTNNYFQAIIDLEAWKIKPTKYFDGLTADTFGLDDMSDMSVAKSLYMVTSNTMNVPVSSLQPPFFIPNAPNYVNYARLGHVMAHEMTHGFDNTGNKYNHEALYKSWWDEQSYETFMKKAECMVEQYSEIVDDGTQLALNGTNTLNENIADNGGYKLAYRAFKRQEAKRGGNEQELPGFLDFTSDQMFFLAAANQHCTAHKPGLVKHIIEHDHHLPEEHRVNVAFMNMREFSTAFGCAPGTYMNPTKKCEVW